MTTDHARTATPQEWTLQQLITDVIGSGPKTADDMTRDQATAGFTHLLTGTPDPVTVGAFLMANRWKHNTPTELAAFVDVMRDHIESRRPTVDPLDCGANYDGKTDTAILGVAAGLIAAAAGTPIAVHSAGRLPTAYGATYRHVLDELDVPTAVSPADSARMVDEVGFGFYDATRFNHALAALRAQREAMGVRTFLNTIETLANPAGARVHLGSFFHLSFAQRVIATIQRSHSLAFDRVVMIQGLEGYDDLRVNRTRLATWNGDEVTDRELRTADVVGSLDRHALAVGDVAGESARITEEILNGTRDDAFTDAVVLNAGVRLWAYGDVETVADGVNRARKTLADEQPCRLLDRLREFRPRR